jgi:hypothetical protein
VGLGKGGFPPAALTQIPRVAAAPASRACVIHSSPRAFNGVSRQSDIRIMALALNPSPQKSRSFMSDSERRSDGSPPAFSLWTIRPFLRLDTNIQIIEIPEQCRMGLPFDRLDPFVSQTPLKPDAPANATPRSPPNTLEVMYSTYRRRRSDHSEADMRRENIANLSAKQFAE